VDDAVAQGGTVEQRLGAFFAAVEEHARAHGRLLAVLMQAGEGPGRARPPRTLLDELTRRANAIVERGVASGELRPDPAGVFGPALVGIARVVLVRAVEGGSEPGETAAAIVQLFLRGAER
jgi:hypothetical protein